MALHDPLTGLPNRTSLNAHLDRLLRADRAGGRTLAVIEIDLDHFKEINDTLGHAFGDMALCDVAERLRGFVGERGSAARLGGDEFCVAATFESEADLARAVEALEELMLRPLRIDGIEAGGRRQHRRGRAPVRRRRPRHADAQRRPGDVPRQIGRRRPERLLLRPRDG